MNAAIVSLNNENLLPNGENNSFLEDEFGVSESQCAKAVTSVSGTAGVLHSGSVFYFSVNL